MASVAPAPVIQADEHVFLIGRPPMTEYLGFVTAQTVEGEAANQRELADAWRKANDHIRELEHAEAGWADSPVVEPLPPTVANLRDRFLADPVLQRTFALAPIDVGMVELDRLVVFQKHINVTYVRTLRATLGEDPGDAAVFRFCLPFDQRNDPVPLAARTAQQGWTFSSPSNDFRPLGVALLSPEQVQGFDLTGVPVAIVAFAIGYGSNFLSALEVEGRLILNNGSHRAYALREAGYTHAPCLLQRVSRRDELEVVGNEEVAQHPDRYLDASRPPVLKDYFDEKLRMTVHVPAKMRQYQVNVGVGAADVPRG